MCCEYRLICSQVREPIRKLEEHVDAAVQKPVRLVVAALILRGDASEGGRGLEVLICQRKPDQPMSLKWEFPGGKIEAGETSEDALARELNEELGIEVNAACLAPFVFASHGYDDFHLLMPLYLCRRWDGFVQKREHQALAWALPTKLADYPMPPADAPLVAYLRDFL